MSALVGAPTLVCDVDNTICNTRPRVRRCLEAIGRGEVFERAPRTYGGFKGLLSPGEVDAFFAIFLSDVHLALDEPLPDAARVLRGWRAGGGRLVYLTGRHDAPEDSMRPGTEAWLGAHGFPAPDGRDLPLVMKANRWEADMAHKRAALARLADRRRLRAGVGDLPQEGPLYADFGLVPILVSAVGLFAEDVLRAAHPAVCVAADWAAVERQLQALQDT